MTDEPDGPRTRGAPRTPARSDPHVRKPKVTPTQSGVATLDCAGFSGAVEYQVDWPGNLRRQTTVRGLIRTTADGALACFRAGKGHLTLENGVEYTVLILAHTAGTEVAYIELQPLRLR